jgi:hypothetical protein
MLSTLSKEKRKLKFAEVKPLNRGVRFTSAAFQVAAPSVSARPPELLLATTVYAPPLIDAATAALS